MDKIKKEKTVKKKRLVGMKLVGLGVIIIFSLLHTISCSKKTTISTDKTKYSISEPIKVVFENNLDEAVWVEYYENFYFVVDNVEEKSNSGSNWKPAELSVPREVYKFRGILPTLKKVLPREEITVITLEPTEIEPCVERVWGLDLYCDRYYRILIHIFFEDPKSKSFVKRAEEWSTARKAIYSNEFIIK